MPMMRPALESLLEKVGNKYALAVLAGKRARQLREGQLPMVEVSAGASFVTAALEEVAAGKVRPEAAGGLAKPVPAVPAVPVAPADAGRVTAGP